MLKRTGAFLLVLVLAASLLTGCPGKEDAQTVTCNELSLTLPGSFEDLSQTVSSNELSLLYGSGTTVVMVTRETVASLEKDFPQLDAGQYAQLFVRSNNLPGKVTLEEGIPTFTYTAGTGENAMTYLCGFYRSETHFWVVQAYCPTKEFDTNRDSLWSILFSVTV